MRQALWAFWQEREVADLGRLLVGLLLMACVWALVGCEIETKIVSERRKSPRDHDYYAEAVRDWRKYLHQVTFDDGTQCVILISSGGVITPVTCNWGCPR